MNFRDREEPLKFKNSSLKGAARSEHEFAKLRL